MEWSSLWGASYARSRCQRAFNWLRRDCDICSRTRLFPTIAGQQRVRNRAAHGCHVAMTMPGAKLFAPVKLTPGQCCRSGSRASGLRVIEKHERLWAEFAIAIAAFPLKVIVGLMVPVDVMGWRRQHRHLNRYEGLAARSCEPIATLEKCRGIAPMPGMRGRYRSAFRRRHHWVPAADTSDSGRPAPAMATSPQRQSKPE